MNDSPVRCVGPIVWDHHNQCMCEWMLDALVGYFVPTNKEKNEDCDVVPLLRMTNSKSASYWYRNPCLDVWKMSEKNTFPPNLDPYCCCCCTKQNVWRRKRSANVGKNETTIEGIIIVFRNCCKCIHFREYIHCSHRPIVRQFCSNEVTNSGVPYELCVINAPISIWVTNRGLVSFIRHRKSHCHLLYHWRTTNGGFVLKRSHERDQQCHV